MRASICFIQVLQLEGRLVTVRISATFRAGELSHISGTCVLVDGQVSLAFVSNIGRFTKLGIPSRSTFEIYFRQFDCPGALDELNSVLFGHVVAKVYDTFGDVFLGLRVDMDREGESSKVPFDP